MRFKSKIEGVYFEPWETLIAGEDIIAFEGILSTKWQTHICVSLYNQKDIHVITLNSRDSYRVFDEDHCCFFRKYFEPEMIELDFDRLCPDPCRTWKIWGTDFVKEIETEKYLASSKGIESVFQSLIVTQDQWIEFICPNPAWTVFSNSNFEEVVSHYLKEDHDFL